MRMTPAITGLMLALATPAVGQDAPRPAYPPVLSLRERAATIDRILKERGL